jgi:hypothetical protein
LQVSVILLYHLTLFFKMVTHVLDAFAKLWEATINFVMSVCLSVRLSAWKNSAATERIFMKFDI